MTLNDADDDIDIGKLFPFVYLFTSTSVRSLV